MSDFGILADKMLAKFGFKATLNNYDNSIFDINAGKHISILNATIACNAVFVGIESGELKEQSYIVNAGDKLILTYCPKTFVVNNTTEVVIDNIKYNIYNIEEVKQKLNTVLYKLIIRQNKTKV